MTGIDIPYKDLTHTLKCIKIQIQDSIPFAQKFIPTDIHTLEDLFYFLKDHTKYKNDPKGIEYIQQFQTLINNNGQGDCDCFTVAAIAACYVCGFSPLYITIVSNNTFSPTHIYAEVYDKDRCEITPFDLTNPDYGQERSYKFKQRLLIRL